MEGSGRTLTATDEDGHVRAEISTNGTIRSLVTCVRDNSTILGVLYYDAESRSTVIKNEFGGTEIGIINGDNTVLVNGLCIGKLNKSNIVLDWRGKVLARLNPTVGEITDVSFNTVAAIKPDGTLHAFIGESKYSEIQGHAIPFLPSVFNPVALFMIFFGHETLFSQRVDLPKSSKIEEAGLNDRARPSMIIYDAQNQMHAAISESGEVWNDRGALIAEIQDGKITDSQTKAVLGSSNPEGVVFGTGKESVGNWKPIEGGLQLSWCKVFPVENGFCSLSSTNGPNKPIKIQGFSPQKSTTLSSYLYFLFDESPIVQAQNKEKVKLSAVDYRKYLQTHERTSPGEDNDTTIQRGKYYAVALYDYTHPDAKAQDFLSFQAHDLFHVQPVDLEGWKIANPCNSKNDIKGFIPGNFIRSLQRAPRNPTKGWKLYESSKTRADRLQFLMDTIPLSGVVLTFEEFVKFIERPIEYSYFYVVFEKIFGVSSTKLVSSKKIPKLLAPKERQNQSPNLGAVPHRSLWEDVLVPRFEHPTLRLLSSTCKSFWNFLVLKKNFEVFMHFLFHPNLIRIFKESYLSEYGGYDVNYFENEVCLDKNELTQYNAQQSKLKEGVKGVTLTKLKMIYGDTPVKYKEFVLNWDKRAWKADAENVVFTMVSGSLKFSLAFTKAVCNAATSTPTPTPTPHGDEDDAAALHASVVPFEENFNYFFTRWYAMGTIYGRDEKKMKWTQQFGRGSHRIQFLSFKDSKLVFRIFGHSSARDIAYILHFTMTINGEQFKAL